MHRVARLVFAYGGLLVVVASYACKTTVDGSSTPSCSDLKVQIDACGNISSTAKNSFPTFCASASDSCRACLDGKLCGVTESCDPSCGKLEVSGGASSTDAGNGSTSTKDSEAPINPPTCNALQLQLEACPDLPANAKPYLLGFCGAISPQCRACLDKNLCGSSVSCAAACTVFTAPSCASLQAQVNACDALSEATKASFSTVCAAMSNACRACLDGNLCGVTEQCDPVCRNG